MRHASQRGQYDETILVPSESDGTSWIDSLFLPAPYHADTRPSKLAPHAAPHEDMYTEGVLNSIILLTYRTKHKGGHFRFLVLRWHRDHVHRNVPGHSVYLFSDKLVTPLQLLSFLTRFCFQQCLLIVLCGEAASPVGSSWTIAWVLQVFLVSTVLGILLVLSAVRKYCSTCLSSANECPQLLQPIQHCTHTYANARILLWP